MEKMRYKKYSVIVCIVFLKLVLGIACTSAWTTATLDSAGDVGNYTSIAVETSGAAYIGYYDDSDEDLEYAVPTASTGAASGITTSSATLAGTINGDGDGDSTTAWFDYGMTSGSYTGSSTTQSISGISTSSTSVSVSLNGLSSGTTYYYRLATSSFAGNSYGSEASFTTSSPSSGGGGDTPKEKLTISSTSPSSGATDVSVTMTVSATFNLLINGSTVTTDSFTLSGNDGNVSGSVVTNGATITFTPSLSLSYGTKYTGKVTTRVQAANYAGTSMETDYTWTFTTEGAPGATPTPTPTATVTATPASAVSPTPTAMPSPPAPNMSPTPLPLPSPEAIKAYGYVYDTEDNPLNAVVVTATSSLETVGGETNKESYYELACRDSGVYMLTYVKDGYETKTITVTIKEGDSVELSDVVMVKKSEENGRIYGYIKNLKGNPVKSAKVKLKGTTTINATVSDAEGYFEFGDLDAGTSVVTAKKKGYKNVKRTVSLAAGEDKEIEVVLKKMGGKKAMAFGR